MSAASAASPLASKRAFKRGFPRLPLAAVLLVLGGVVAASLLARVSGFAAPAAQPPVVASLALQFTDLADGGVAVSSADTGKTMYVIPARADGFVRMTLRTLAAIRTHQHIGAAKPFRLDELAGGREQLTDTATGETLELQAFGPSNIAEFAAIMAAGAKK